MSIDKTKSVLEPQGARRHDHTIMFETCESVYHYTSAAIARIHVLPSMTLRMGSFNTLNDPREAKRWPFKFYSRSQDEPFDKTLFVETSRLVTDRSFVLCCSRDDPAAGHDPLQMGFGHPRMWAQY